MKTIYITKRLNLISIYLRNNIDHVQSHFKTTIDMIGSGIRDSTYAEIAIVYEMNTQTVSLLKQCKTQL